MHSNLLHKKSLTNQFKESNLHMAPQTAVQNDAYDNAYDSSDDEMY